jgi:hypothetical protein
VYFLAHFCPVAFFQHYHAQENPLLVVFLLAQKCTKKCKKIILFRKGVLSGRQYAVGLDISVYKHLQQKFCPEM